MFRVVLVGVLFSASMAVAAPSARLEITGAACPAVLIEDRTRALVGYEPFDVTSARVIEVSLESIPSPGATVRVDDAERHLVAETCDELADAVALVIAMALREPPPPAPRPARTRTVIPSETAVRAVVDPASPITVHALAGSSIGGSSSGVLARLQLGAALRRGDASVGLEGAVELPEAFAVGAGGHATITTSSVAVVPCMHHGRFAGCGLVIGGAIHGRTADLPDSRSKWSPRLAVGGRLAWQHAMTSRASIRITLDVDTPVIETRFLVDDMPVWTTPSIEVWAGFGVIAHFL